MKIWRYVETLGGGAVCGGRYRGYISGIFTLRWRQWKESIAISSHAWTLRLCNGNHFYFFTNTTNRAQYSIWGFLCLFILVRSLRSNSRNWISYSVRARCQSVISCRDVVFSIEWFWLTHEVVWNCQFVSVPMPYDL